MWALSLVFLAGGFMTGYFVLTKAKTALGVWVIGGTIGAAEWLLLGVALTDVSLRLAMENQAFTDFVPTGVEQFLLPLRIYSLGGVGITLYMALFCLIISLIAHKVERTHLPEHA